ncbi:MAG TPA: amidohydrolase family protein [Burkholderiales bacterium]|nr:amidohydrolase family protein [Burkholderiales bacterium]
MAFDLLIKNGRVIDGSGMPAFKGDVGIRNGRIAELGKLSGPAKRTIDAEERVVSPGFVDNHCHFDAQVTWDPLCSFSPQHGATTVVFGNCSLALAPIRPGTAKRVAEFLSYVEAIPMDVLDTVDVEWESIAQYMNRLEGRLGVNVGNFIGHTPVRYYVMGDESQERTATDDEIRQMQDIVRDGLKAGALGFSVSRNRGHYDPQGKHIPALLADEKEIFAIADVLRELGTGIIQCGGGRAPELRDGLMARLSEATGRTVIYNNLGQTYRDPDAWKKHMARLEETAKAGIRAFPLCSPNRTTQHFTMKNCQVFRGTPTWHPILLASDGEKLRAYADPAIRRKLHEEVVEHKGTKLPAPGYSQEWWKYLWVYKPALEKNKGLTDKTIEQLAKEQGKGYIDAFLDLVVEEKLETEFMQSEINVDKDAMKEILTHPNAIVGLSDGGAHVQFHGGYGYCTRLLAEWVREKQIMSLELAVRRLTFDSASALGLYDRGLLRPGLNADVVIFDPDTVKPGDESIVHDFPANGWRVKEPAEGVVATIVNGEVLLENGEHTGALPGKVARNTYYLANA